MKAEIMLLAPAIALLMLGPPDVSAFAVYGAIGDKYAQLGRDHGPLGPPLSDEGPAAFGGRFNRFQNGFIYWHPETGAHAVWGAIAAKWNNVGREKFGYPITDETRTPDDSGRFNHFRAIQLPGRPDASIYWTPQTGAQAIYGAIRGKWASLGWERGALGYPTTDEYQEGGYRRSNFQHGFIKWSPSRGAVASLPASFQGDVELHPATE